ncbi:protein split ends-like [Uranotaenia lowii]|uniref:protein split ends-like n=1 Tax=Uranotaenia lowii TaxID=190385 RepID=UPI00247842D4|nr:protein split ends-like [Uranotaenia lowii]
MEMVTSSTDKGLQQNAAIRRRQTRQKVLNRIRKVNIKNKGAKSFYYFTYATVTAADGNGNKSGKTHSASTYFFNGEPCEGDEHFLRQMKRSIFVSNLTAGSKKSEIKTLFDRYGRIGAIQLRTRTGETIVGRQHISPYSPIVAVIKFSKKAEAQQACESKDGKFIGKIVEMGFQYEKENSIRVDNVEPRVSKTELRDHFKTFGQILNITLETTDGSLILTDNEYLELSYVCCYVRFSRRAEAKAAKDMNEYIFRDRKLRVELAYQKHCDPNKMSNNALRMFFQNFGEVITLDQIPHQHMGYVCYKSPLSADLIKRLGQRIYRNKKIHFEKLDISNLVKANQKQQQKNEPSMMVDNFNMADNAYRLNSPTAPDVLGQTTGTTSVKKGSAKKPKATQKKVANTSMEKVANITMETGVASSAVGVKPKVQRKSNAGVKKSAEKNSKAREDFT